MTAQYFVSYNGITGQYSAFLGEKKIVTMDSESEVWRYIQAIEAWNLLRGEPQRNPLEVYHYE